MKITKSQLKQIIKEEMQSVLDERAIPGSPDNPMDRISEIERRLELVETIIDMNIDKLQTPG